ncbi:hypothetical protein C3L33_06466, partial [Rhododendron williamsianum]
MAKFKRVAEAFDKAAAKARRLCGGDQYSPPETAEDLSDLVKSFMERGEEGGLGEEREGNINGSESDGDCSDWELRDELSALLGCGDDDQVKRNIRLCKSKWDRIGLFPSGSHEYMDVTVSGTRYIIEFSLSDEFSIARATECYSSLLQLVHPIFVGKVEELKQVVRLMCNAIKVSMKSMDMHVPPWRRFGYMKAKWFGSDFERTTGKVTVEMSSGPGSDLGRQRSVGFGPVPLVFSYYCREDFASKVGLKVGQLAVAFDGANILL